MKSYRKTRDAQERRVKEARARINEFVEGYQDRIFDSAAYYIVTYKQQNGTNYRLDLRSLCEAIALASPLKPRALVYAVSDVGLTTLMPYTMYDKCLESWAKKWGSRYDPEDQIFRTADHVPRWYCFVNRVTYGPFLDEASAKINMVRLRKSVETPHH